MSDQEPDRRPGPSDPPEPNRPVSSRPCPMQRPRRVPTALLLLALGMLLAAGGGGARAEPERGRAGAAAPGPPFDASGFPEGAGRDVVIANCTACHSGRLVQQNRATRDGWREIIRWMQATQKLWHLEPQVEDAILGYLETVFGRPAEADGQRRPPLPADLMPPPASALPSANGGSS